VDLARVTAPFTKHEDGFDWVHVVAGALIGERGEVLIAERPRHKAHGGLWEFPGGKREAGESATAALAREFDEELGVTVRTGHPLIRVRHRYDDFALILDVFAVHGFDGLPVPREGQALAWVPPASLRDYRFPAANDPIVAALSLPRVVLVTPAIDGPFDPILDRIAECCEAGVDAVQLRPDPATRRHDPLVAQRMRSLCSDLGVRFIVNGTVGEALAFSADAVHLTDRRLRAMSRGQIPPGLVAGASCHSPLALEHAARVGCDYASLSPVLATASHPGATPLGWRRVLKWCRRARLPVYALGGLSASDLGRAVHAGCQGIAMIRGALEAPDLDTVLRGEFAALRRAPLDAGPGGSAS